MQSSDYDVETLNDLIATLIDSVDGYRAAAGDGASERLQALLDARAKEREGVADRLQIYVSELGGKPAEDGSAAGGVDRLLPGLRDTASGTVEKEVAAEIERGEEQMIAKFERALSDADLSTCTHALIEQSFEALKQSSEGGPDLKLAA